MRWCRNLDRDGSVLRLNGDLTEPEKLYFAEVVVMDKFKWDQLVQLVEDIKEFSDAGDLDFDNRCVAFGKLDKIIEGVNHG